MADDPHRAAIARGEALLAGLAEKYLEVARRDLHDLEAATAALADDPDDREAQLRRVFGIAHDMKGQGATFGYALVTTICNQLCRFVEAIDGPGSEADVAVVARHVAAVRTVLRDELTDPADRRARRLITDLDDVLSGRS